MHPELPYVPPAQRCVTAPIRVDVHGSPGRRHAPGTAERRVASRGARLVASLMPLLLGVALLVITSVAHAATVRLSPAKGHAGSKVKLHGAGFPEHAKVRVRARKRTLAHARTNARGAFTVRLRIPRGRKRIVLRTRVRARRVKNVFRVVKHRLPLENELADSRGERLRWWPTDPRAGSRVAVRGHGLRRPARMRVRLTGLGRASQAVAVRSKAAGILSVSVPIPATARGPLAIAVQLGSQVFKLPVMVGPGRNNGNGNSDPNGNGPPADRPDHKPPTAPTGLIATGGDAQVQLGWNAAGDKVNLAGYRVYRQNSDGSWQAIGTTGPNTVSYADTGLANGRTYTYTVAAFDGAGNESAPSASASATPQQPPDTTAPTAPQGLTTNAGDGHVELKWSPGRDDRGVVAYRIYRQNADGSWPLTSTANTDAGTLAWTDTGLTNGQTYTYRVTAVDAAGNESDPSATASASPQLPPDVTAPSAPSGLNATAGDGQVDLSWSAASDDRGVAGYRVYRQNGDGSWPSPATASLPADARAFTDGRLTNGTAYTYRVTAVDGAGN